MIRATLVLLGPVPAPIDRDVVHEQFRKRTLHRAPAQLDQLGIDRPYWRWKEARTYIHALHARALVETRALWCEWLILMRAKLNWHRRGRPGWGGPDATDMADAIEWFKQNFFPDADLIEEGSVARAHAAK